MARFMRFLFAMTSPRGTGRIRTSITLVLCTAALFGFTRAVAATATSAAPSAASSTAKKSQPPLGVATKPAWRNLTPVEQSSLQPLAANWETLSEAQKRKWIAMALNYPRMNPTEQAKLHSRMTEWVSLSRQQRERARLNFAETKQLTPSQKNATWQAYQALSAEEKQKLAAKEVGKPTGATTPAKAGAHRNLATVPRSAPTLMATTSKMAASSQTLNRNTLLPASRPRAGAEASAKD